MRGDKLECFAALLAYLEQNPCAGLDAASNALHYSKYHLHRLFSQAAGMSLQEYLRRAKLTQAARLLVKTNRPYWKLLSTAAMRVSRPFRSPSSGHTAVRQRIFAEEGSFIRCSFRLMRQI